MYLFEGVALASFVLGQVDTAETALADGLDYLVGLHLDIIINLQRTTKNTPNQ